MIDVKDLRMGDYVYLQSSKTPYRITEIGYSEIEYPSYESRLFHFFAECPDSRLLSWTCVLSYPARSWDAK